VQLWNWTSRWEPSIIYHLKHYVKNSEEYLRPRKIDRPKYEPYVEPETIPVYFPVYDDGYTNPEQRSGKGIFNLIIFDL